MFTQVIGQYLWFHPSKTQNSEPCIGEVSSSIKNLKLLDLNIVENDTLGKKITAGRMPGPLHLTLCKPKWDPEIDSFDEERFLLSHRGNELNNHNKSQKTYLDLSFIALRETYWGSLQALHEAAYHKETFYTVQSKRKVVVMYFQLELGDKLIVLVWWQFQKIEEKKNQARSN